MKRRNFLSGLLAAPLALKARLAQFFGRKPICNAPIGNVVLWKQPEPDSIAQLSTLPNGPALILALQKGIPTRIRPVFIKLASCSLPRGHKGPHVLLNPH